MRKKPRIALSVLLSGALIFTSISFVSADIKERAKKMSVGGDYYFVQLKDRPVATYQGGVKGYSPTMVGLRKRLSVSTQAVKKYRTYLGAERSRYKNWLKGNLRSAKVATEYSLAFNGLGVKATAAEAAELAKGPGVVRVVRGKMYTPMMNRSNEIIRTRPAWRSGYNGAGVKVAVIDSGIDQNHPFLKDSTLAMPSGFPKVEDEDSLKYTSSKVIVAKVFSPDPDATPLAIGSHGTHVAGTIAGKAGYVDPRGRAEGKLSGVAPKAYLGNYNVFPCEEDKPCQADSIHIAAAVEAAVNDGMDVANLSLGSAATPGFDLLVEVINAANKAGMATVISAGNSGSKPMTIGSPGIADEAITVAAVHNSHFFGQYAKVNAEGKERVFSIGSSDPGGKITTKIEAPLAVIKEDDGLGSKPITEDLTGKVAVFKRGGCTFSEKAKNAKDKGAVGVVIVNNKPGDPNGMQVEESITIPVVMVSDTDGAWISNSKEASITLEPGKEKEFLSSLSEAVADFSSRGPTVNYTLKPDVAAVGVNVFSSVVGGDLASYNGTSMSAPHVTGAVAILLQAHPDWTPKDVKAALIATGRDPKGGAIPSEVGGGIINVGRALHPVALCYPSSLSFGKFNRTEKKTMRVVVKNSSSAFHTYKMNVTNNDLKLNKSSIRLSSGNQGAFEVTVGRSTRRGQHQGYIELATSNGSIRIPYYFYVE